MGEDGALTGSSTGSRGRNYDAYAGVFFLAVGAFAFLWGPGWGPRQWVFPNFVSTILMVQGTVLLIIGLFRTEREYVFETWKKGFDAFWFTASVLVFFMLIQRIGYLYATWLFVAAQVLILGNLHKREKVGVAIVGAVVGSGLLAFALHRLFAGVFRLRLPRGEWWAVGEFPTFF